MCSDGHLVFPFTCINTHLLVSRTYFALAPDDGSLLLSEEVVKSTPPRPILGAGAADMAVDEANRDPSVNPPPPRVV